MRQKQKVIHITEEQLQFLKEKKGLLFEYYDIVSDPKRDAHILGDLQIWVYGNDRQDFTPHCHIMSKDRSLEIEVSILDWSILNVKRPNNLPCDWSAFSKVKKAFNTWLMAFSKRGQMTNKRFLFVNWDGNNPNNQLEDYIAEHDIELKDETLVNYLRELND